MSTFFHSCMQAFELCYTLEDQPHISLAPLRFPYQQPPIPWAAIPGARERLVEYHFEGDPPAGLMSRFIVKTHHLIEKSLPKGVYWHHGVFLEQADAPYRAQALCELDPEKRLIRFTVRAAHPQNFIEQLEGFIRAVFSFFKGFRPVRYYGCVRAERPCPTRYKEITVAQHLNRDRELLCDEGHEVHPLVVVGGFLGFNRDPDIRAVLRQELDKPPAWAASFGVDLAAL